ncbi:MAG: protein kinase domain-containing protein, partial [Myxococcota bacterium]
MHLGRYEVIRKIGAGGFGEVLLARSLGAEGFERIVAVKRLRGELTRKEGGLQGIINEARIGGLLNHPNVVQVLEFIQVGSDYLLVMEYVDGLGLQDLLDLDRTQPNLLEPAHAFDIVIQACEGLHYAHSARSATGQPLKLIHRDIKPSNLMVTRTGTVKVMDFGVARAVTNSGQSSTGSIKGTLRYLSPEQAEGSKEIGHSSDLFSLGLVLCEMINKQPVYEAEQEHLVLLKALQGKNSAAMEQAEQRVPGLGSILKKCLAFHQEERYRSAEEMSLALRQLRVRYPYHGEGLSGLVEKTLELRGPHPYEDDVSTDATFSLQLKRKAQMAPRRGRHEPEVPTEQVPRAAFLAALKPTAALQTPQPASEPRDLEELMDSGPWEWEWRMEEKSDGSAWAGDEFDRVAPPSQPIVHLSPPAAQKPRPGAPGPAAPMLSRGSLELSPSGGSKNGAGAWLSTSPRKTEPTEPLAAISLWGSEPVLFEPPAARPAAQAPANPHDDTTDRVLPHTARSLQPFEGSTDRIVPARLNPSPSSAADVQDDDGEVFESGIFDMEDLLDDPASTRFAHGGTHTARLSLNANGMIAIPTAAARHESEAVSEQKTQRVDPEVARKVREQAAAALKAQAEARKTIEEASRAEAEAARKAAEAKVEAEAARKAAEAKVEAEATRKAAEAEATRKAAEAEAARKAARKAAE